MSLPIRVRLSISYFVIFSLAALLLCAASYILARRSLHIALQHELDEHIDDVSEFFLTRNLVLGSLGLQDQVETEFALKDDGKWLQIRDDRGNWIYRSRRMMLDPHDLPAPQSIPTGGTFQELRIGGKRVLTLIRRVVVQGRLITVESGATLTKTDQTLALFRNQLFFISPAIFLMAGLAGHLLSRRALAPVAAIAQEAQRIHDGNLQIRLPELNTRDELAHLSKTLNEMLERIESGVRSVRDFTAYASHELRTPVALIRTEAELALHFNRSSEDYRDALGVIGEEAVRMSSLLDSLLFLARADAGAEQVQLEPVDARELCLQAFEKWRPMLLRAGLQLHTELPVHDTTILADPRYLLRLLTILLENAAKYTPSGGTVRLSLSVGQDLAVFRVSDTGIGIPPEDRQLIFERFCRGSNVQQSSVYGSGLGLALASWIAARHNTTIQVDSTIGAGSTFSWTLPALPDSSSVHRQVAQHSNLATFQ